MLAYKTRLSLRWTDASPAAWRPFTSVPPRSSAPPRVRMGWDQEPMEAPAPSCPSLRLHRGTSTAHHSDNGASKTPFSLAASSKPVVRSMQPVHAWSSAFASFEPQHAPLSLDTMVLALQTSTFRLCVRKAPLVAQRMQQLQQDLAETSAVARTLQAERLQVQCEYQRLCMEAATNDHHAIMLSGLVDEGCLELATCQHQLQQAKCGSSASSICAVDAAEQETQMLARLQRTYDHIAGHLQQASASRQLSTVPALPLLELAPGISDVAQLSAALQQEKKRLQRKRCSAAASQHVVVQQLVRLRSLDRQLLLMSLRLQCQQTRPGSLDLIHDPALEMKADTIFRQKNVHSLYKGMAALLIPRLA